MLVVCEGSHTEPQYFRYLIAAKKSKLVTIDVRGEECGSDPASVVDYALTEASTEGHFSNGGYRFVYCVVDRDSHATWHSAAQKIKGKNKAKKKTFQELDLITSVPCFEFWLLLHFDLHNAPIVDKGGRSCGAECVRVLRLKNEMKSYDKRLTKEQLERLLEKTSSAITNARKVAHDNASTGADNPSTSVHELVEKITSDSWGCGSTK